MKLIRCQALVLFFISVSYSCKKDPEKDPCDNGTPYKLTATIDGNNWCANTSLFADKGTVLTINGINQNGSTLTLELDDFTPGRFQILESRNHILYTDAIANAYESTDDNPGTLIITSNNETTNVIKGTFNFTGRSPLAGNKTLGSGSFELFYTE